MNTIRYFSTLFQKNFFTLMIERAWYLPLSWLQHLKLFRKVLTFVISCEAMLLFRELGMQQRLESRWKKDGAKFPRCITVIMFSALYQIQRVMVQDRSVPGINCFCEFLGVSLYCVWPAFPLHCFVLCNVRLLLSSFLSEWQLSFTAEQAWNLKNMRVKWWQRGDTW